MGCHEVRGCTGWVGEEAVKLSWGQEGIQYSRLESTGVRVGGHLN